MNTRKTCLIMICLLLLLEASWGAAGSMVSFSELFKSNCVILADAKDVEFRASGWGGYLQIISFETIKGDKPTAPLEISKQIFRLPQHAKKYLIFLKHDQNRFELINKACSIVGLGTDFPISSSDLANEACAIHTLCKLLENESDETCALLQSIMLSGYGRTELSSEWPNIMKRGSDNSYAIQLAVANVGVRVVGADALEIIKTASQQKAAETTIENAYLQKAQRRIVTWAYGNANRANASKIFNYALTCESDIKADLITAVGKHLNTSTIPLLASLLKTQSETPLVQYSCMSAIMHILNEGHGVITVDEFMKDPQTALKPTIELLEKNKLWK